MSLCLLLGGARSGKSALALSRAARRCQPVTFIATAEPRDDEFAERIARHRAERPPEWLTLEVPVEIGATLAALSPSQTAVIDCLTLWLSNLLESGLGPAEVLARAAEVAACAAARPGDVVVVSNEVGSGIVPADPLSRAYRDLLGSVNATFSRQADEAYLVVAGRLLPLGQPTWEPEAGPL